VKREEYVNRESMSYSCGRQVSNDSSVSVDVDLQVLPPLPPELETKILHCVPTRQLVRTCMLVSKSWCLFLKDPSFWISKMTSQGSYDVRLAALDGVEWPKLCLHTVEKQNLLKCFNSEGKLRLEPYWRMTDTRWDKFKLARTENRSIRWNRGGGDKWSIEESIDKNKPEDQAVLKANGGSCENYVTSYIWCCREQVVDLAAIGLTATIMDSVRPAISVSEWFCARWDCASRFCIRVELLSSSRELVEFFEGSEETDQWQGGEIGWRLIRHTFEGYGDGVRYVRFADAGKDCQYWAGHYGSKMAAATMTIYF